MRLLYPAGHWRDPPSPLIHEIGKGVLDLRDDGIGVDDPAAPTKAVAEILA